MKKLLFILPLLTLFSLAQAETVSGISPSGDCETFNNLDLPEDYRSVHSCENVQDEDRYTSLEQRLRARFAKRINKVNEDTNAATEQRRMPAKYIRAGRGSLIKSEPAVSGETRRNESDLKDRTSTRQNFQSLYRTYRMKNGSLEDKEATSPRKAYQRPGYRSRSVTSDATDAVSSTPLWSAASRGHFREKNYGTNPYSLASQRSAQQRAYRETKAANQRVDVQGRALSRSRTWRPGRIIGDLGGDADWLKEQAELKGDVIKKLNSED